MDYRNKSNIPNGFRDLFFESALKRKKIEREIENIFIKKGFKPVIPPTVEFSSVFLRGTGEDGFYKLLQFFDENGELLSLRADLTCSVARMVCTTLSNLKMPLRVYYISNIFRKSKVGNGKLIETTQAGIEIIGDSSIDSDIETLSLAISIMRKTCGEKFSIILGHSKILEGFFDEIPLSTEGRKTALKIIQKRSKFQWNDFVRNLQKPIKERFESLLDLIGDEKILLKGEKVFKNEKSAEAISVLRKISRSMGLKKRYLLFDLAKVKNFDYYTGIIFSIISPQSGFTVGSGGRYDELLKKFGKNLPAVGFSLNIDLLEEVI